MIGTTLGQYRIESEAGQGGMGVVYRATDTRLGRTVAIKVLRPDAVADPDRKSRFIQEAKSASALNHPGIVTIYQIGSEGATDFIAMEFVTGRSLDRVIGKRPLPMADAVRYAVQIAEALSAIGSGRLPITRSSERPVTNSIAMKSVAPSDPIW
jgi:serine/threonine protein kinase